MRAQLDEHRRRQAEREFEVVKHPWLFAGVKATLNDSESPSVGAPEVVDEAHSKAAKVDVNFLFQFPKALEAVAKVLEFGAEGKEYAWRHFTTLPLDKQRASLTRHLLATGEKHDGKDDESGMLHAVHAASRALMYLESILTKED